jgi:predicted component of type VI protein secretion system
MRLIPCFVAAALLFASVAQAALPAIPDIPVTLPQTITQALIAKRAPLAGRKLALIEVGKAINSDCARVEEGSAAHRTCLARLAEFNEQVETLRAESDRLADEIEAAVASAQPVRDAECASLQQQLARDREALLRQKHVNEATVRELEAWAADNEKAQREAVQLGMTSLFSAAAVHLESKEASARAFRGWLTRYEKQMRVDGVPIEALQGRIERSMRGYVNARVQASAGAAMNVAADANALYEYAQTEAGVIAQLQGAADADVKAVLEDPAFARFVQTDATGWDLLRGTLDQLSGLPALKKLAPHYAIAAFVVDYGYDARKWGTSGARILQDAKLSDLELKAVKTLSDQMKRTVARLAACRAASTEE